MPEATCRPDEAPASYLADAENPGARNLPVHGRRRSCWNPSPIGFTEYAGPVLKLRADRRGARAPHTRPGSGMR